MKVCRKTNCDVFFDVLDAGRCDVGVWSAWHDVLRCLVCLLDAFLSWFFFFSFPFSDDYSSFTKMCEIKELAEEHTHTHIPDTQTQAQTHMRAHTYTPIPDTQTHTHPHRYTHTHAYRQINRHTQTHMRTQTDTDTDTRTNTHSFSQRYESRPSCDWIQTTSSWLKIPATVSLRKSVFGCFLYWINSTQSALKTRTIINWSKILSLNPASHFGV